MNTILTIILILSFVALLVYILRGGNLIVGFFLISLLWFIVSGNDALAIQKAFSDKIVSSASTVFAVIFGSWFGRVLVDTEIVSTLIKKTVELGGDKPKITVILLTFVSTAIFSSVYGIGITMAVGLITLPIMFSLGVPKPVAVTSFCLAHAAGMMVNPNWFSQLKVYFPAMEYNTESNFGGYFKNGLMCLVAAMVVAIVMVIVRLGKGKVQHTWAAQAPMNNGPKKLFILAYFTPIFPVILVAFLKFEIISALIASIVLTVILTGDIARPKQCVELLMRTLREGMADIAILIGVMSFIWIYSAAAKSCAPILKPLISAILPASPLIAALAFGILAPLGLFRGPLTLSGVGSALVAILAATFDQGSTPLYSYMFTAMLIWVTWTAMTPGCCPTQSTNAWLLSYTKLDTKEHVKSTLPWVWILAIIMAVIVYINFGNLPIEIPVITK